MATRRDIEVGIGVDQTALTAGLSQAMGAIQRAGGSMSVSFGNVGRAADQASAAIRRSAASTGIASRAAEMLRSRLGGLVAVYAAWRAATAAIRTADQMALITSRMTGLIGSTEGARNASEQLFRIAQRLQVPYEGLGDAFARMYPAVQQLNGGIEETTRLSEILAITARLSGAGTAEATSAQIQFAQALSSGVLQGDELKSILENNNTLARALADGLGVQVGKLREMGKAGELTASRVANALLGQYDKLQSRSDEIALTVGGAWDTVGNAFGQLVDRFSNSTGVLGVLVAVFRGLGQAIEAVARMFTRAEKDAAALARVKIKEWSDMAARGFGILADGVTLMTTNVRALITVWTTMFKIVQRIADLEFGKAWDEAVAGAGRVADIVRGNVAILQGEAGVYREIVRMQAEIAGGGGSGGTSTLSGGGGKAGKAGADPDIAYGKDMARQIGEERAALLRLAEQDRQIQQIRLDATRARIADTIDAEAEAAQQLRDDGQITADQLINLQVGYEQRRTALARAMLQERLNILALDPEANPVERARILGEIEQLEITHGAKLREIRSKLAAESSAFGQQFWPALQNGTTQFANGIAQGTIRIGNIWRTMWQGLVQITFSALAQIGARWLVTQLMAMTGAKSAASSQVAANAAVAGSAGVASAAAIPFYGWAMAPAAGASTYAAAMAFAAGLAIPAAASGYDVPSGLNPITQLHQREMVLPAKHADVIRGMAENGGGGGGMNVTFAVSAMDGKSFGEFLIANTDQLADGMKKAARKAGFRID